MKSRSFLTGLVVVGAVACESPPNNELNGRAYEAHNTVLTARQPREYEQFRTLELRIERTSPEGATSASLKCAYTLDDSTEKWIGTPLHVLIPLQQESPVYELQLANRDDLSRESCDTLTLHPKLDWTRYIWDRTVVYKLGHETTTYGRRNIERVN